jgi:DNA-binding XRE family transcriptional regulator
MLRMNTTFSKDRRVICNGEKIRQLRAEAGMTQEKLAIMSNVNPRTVQGRDWSRLSEVSH